MLATLLTLLLALSTPCASEDSNGPCHWDADSRGNGQGTSFIVLDN